MLVGLVVRCLLVASRSAQWRPDSYSYLELSTLGLTDPDRWVGPRTPLVPLLLDLTGGEPGTIFMYLQIVIASIGWGYLAFEVSAFARSTGRRWLVAALVLALSLTTPVTLWDRLVLTETITLALAAAVTGLVLRWSRTGSAVALVALVPVALVWAAARDTIAVVLIGGAGLAVLAWLVGGRRRWVVPAVAVILFGIGIGSLVGAGIGKRDRSPMANVFAVRVFPFEERTNWFIEHGMPEGERFHAAREAAPPPKPGQPLVVGISRDDVEDGAWWRWLESEGKATYIRFVLSHPTYLLGEPLKEPHRSFFSNGGHTGWNFEADDLRRVPLVRFLWWRTNYVMIALVAGGAALVATGRRRHPLTVVAALVTICGSAYGLAAWHGDGLEAARHVFAGGAALRIALVLVVSAFVVDQRTGEGSEEVSASVPVADG